jgi:predicted MPP superfamily phosphohydrolase
MNRRSENPYESFKHKNTGRLKTPNASADLFVHKKRRPPVMRVLLLALCVLFLAGGAYNFVLNRRVHVQTLSVSIPGLPGALEGYTLLHLSDLYGALLGDEQEKIREALSGRSFQAVCITGDMAAPSGDIQPFLQLLDALDAAKPIFFIAGEQDPDIVMNDASQGESVLSHYVTSAQQHGAMFLDAPLYLESVGEKIWFTPESALTLDVDATEAALTRRLAQEKEKNESGADAYILRQSLEYQLNRTRRIRQAREQMQDDELCVVLTHVPLRHEFIAGTAEASAVNKLISRMDLVLAGHYNGGQACLPLLGPIYLPNLGFFPGTQQVSGLFTIGEMLEHVSPGLGVNPQQLIPMRLFNPPTVTLLRLTGKIE